tara:strand:- start:178 stop:873 length:696 start_codon:yes stop_codon:yes gene_type:complete
MNNIFIGYDTRQDISYQVCEHSIQRYNKDVEIYPLVQNNLREGNLYWRDVDKLGSTEFTFTRFLVPHLMDYKGWALFCDSDFLFLDDVQQLFDKADDKYAVMCVKHDYTPVRTVKMDIQEQHLYPRKNWSSLVLWNCGHPSNQKLALDNINDMSYDGKYFHRFGWLDDSEIGDISLEWNYLVGWYENIATPKALHFTEGGPWFKEYRNCEYSFLWKDALFEMMKKERNLKA